jgi:hypothetical protein
LGRTGQIESAVITFFLQRYGDLKPGEYDAGACGFFGIRQAKGSHFRCMAFRRENVSGRFTPEIPLFPDRFPDV